VTVNDQLPQRAPEDQKIAEFLMEVNVQAALIEAGFPAAAASSLLWCDTDDQHPTIQ
jgi:hypothetical protein